MPLYRVTYFYLATGMEGRADVQDYGTVAAATPDEAKQKAARQRYPYTSASDLAWIVGCLTAKHVAS